MPDLGSKVNKRLVIVVVVVLAVVIVAIALGVYYGGKNGDDEEGQTMAQATPHFEDGVKIATVASSYIIEASGLCASRIHPNVLYTHNDSGGRSRIYAINATSGTTLSTIEVDGVGSHDWEDIACGPCSAMSEQKCVFIADTGGNVDYAANVIYRIVEPARLHSNMTVRMDSKLQFSWSEEDCETVMVDPQGEVYIISKVHGGRGKMVQLPSHAWGSSNRTSIQGGIHLNLNSSRVDPVAGDISPSGVEVLVKTQSAVNYYYVPDGDYLHHMKGKPIQLPYLHERQGESVCWTANGRGYYTLGEGANQPLYYYQRKLSSALQ